MNFAGDTPKYHWQPHNSQANHMKEKDNSRANDLWQSKTGCEPLLATAVHDGNALRPEVRELMKLGDAERLREEDPHTSIWAGIADNHIIATRSRFECDINRPRESAIYVEPEDAWGLEVWHEHPGQDLIDRSLHVYDTFYAGLNRIYEDMTDRFGTFLVLDLHSYNHQRGGPGAEYDDPVANPEVNIGTGTMDRNRWAPIVDTFIDALRSFDFGGRHLDVRENVKFRGGNHPRWGHATYPGSACVIAVEFKKFFMDEWTGGLDSEQHDLATQALRSATEAVMPVVRKMGN
jgi:N-formylglutamate deformylase